jgi:hypothetical protein
MGVSFFASRDNSGPDCTFGELSVDVTGTSAVHLLTVLGVENPVEQADGGEMTSVEMLLRISVAQAEGGAETAQRRWGKWHTPGYFQVRLAELAEVAREAEQMGGEVVWA